MVSPKNNLLIQGSAIALLLALLPTAQSLIDTKIETGKFDKKEVSNFVFLVIGTSLSMVARHDEDPTTYTPRLFPGRNKEEETLLGVIELDPNEITQ
jgi:hypothetical protein